MMTLGQQRIAIAEKMGWYKFDNSKSGDGYMWERVIGNSTIRIHEVNLPNFPESLDAMHSFLITLSLEDLVGIARQLEKMLNLFMATSDYAIAWLLRAKSEHTCEAACRYFYPEKWKE